jgi:hypothetical protein
MIKKKILVAERIRQVDGGFSFIPHRFLTGGFLSSLNPHEILLYFFLVLSGDRNGLSFYSYDKICTLMQMSLDQYIQARNGLMEKDLIAFDGTIYQVLSLPKQPVKKSALSNRQIPMQTTSTQQLGKILKATFKGQTNG